MTSRSELEHAPECFGITVGAERMKSLQHEFDGEPASITVFPDARQALHLLLTEGISIGICSNLAMPYGPVLRRLFGEVSTFAFSYELGMMKPEPDIYCEICRGLGLQPLWDMTASGNRVVMVGDSIRCDRGGPRAVGISGYHLDRNGAGRIVSLEQFAQLVIQDRRISSSALLTHSSDADFEPGGTVEPDVQTGDLSGWPESGDSRRSR